MNVRSAGPVIRVFTEAGPISMIDWRATLNSLCTFVIGAAFGAWLVVIDRQDELADQNAVLLRIVEREQLMTDQALQREQQMMDMIVREEKRK